MTRTRCDHTAAWSALQASFNASGRSFDLNHAFATDASRFQTFSLSAPHVFADLSKNLINAAAQAQLFDLARQCGMEQHRHAMFVGDRVNVTEQRSVLHFLLRDSVIEFEQQPAAANKTIAEDFLKVHETLDIMLAYAQALREDEAITDVVNIGIGGSDLGPQMAVLALDEFVIPGKRFHFVSNVDGHELAAVLQRVRPDSTLFLIASKTFTTVETMTNAQSAKR